MPQIITSPISESNWQVEMQGSTSYFTSKKGGGWEFKTDEYANGLAGGEINVRRVGGKKKKNITLSKPRQTVDQSMIDWCANKNAEKRTLDLVCYDDLGNILFTERYTGALPVSLDLGEIDLNGTNLTELEIELSWEEVQFV